MSKAISIIIPVYNAEKYLRECLQSVATQSFNDYEVIIIDDGSTDSSYLIIKEFTDKCPNVFRCISTDNNGVATARNIGVDNACGEYIAFVDSDDTVSYNMLELLYEKAIIDSSDIVIGGYVRNSKYRKRVILPDKGLIKCSCVKETPSIMVKATPYIWNKLFRKKFLDEYNIRFNKLRIFEDLLFTYQCFIVAKKISAVYEIIYNYKVGSATSISTNYSDKMNDVFLAIEKLIEFCEDQNVYCDLEKYIEAIALKHIFLRLETPVKKNLRKSQFDFLIKSFEFLDATFCDWNNNTYYFMSHNKDYYIDKQYWIKELKRIYPIRMLKRYFFN